MRFLVHNHTTLRTQTADSNRSRWPLHPLWQDLQSHVAQIEGLGVVREVDKAALLDERLLRMAISVYGYLKRIGAIKGVKKNTPEISFEESFTLLRQKLDRIHDDLTWENDVRRRYDQMRLGQW